MIMGILSLVIGFYYFKYSRKSFKIVKTNYRMIAETMVPINLFIAVTMDLYYLFYGASILAIPVPPLFILVSLVSISFLISFVTVYSIKTIFFQREDSMVKRSILILTLALIGVLSILVLHFMTNLSITYSSPLIALLFAPIVVYALNVNRFNPYPLIAISILIGLLSIIYLLYAFLTYGAR